MNILITDDERLVRVNFISMVEELYPGEHHIDQAKDGKEMINMLEKSFYDVAFLDINMPKMNGLDALKICRRMSPDTQCCILTGYAEFEYARRAISLGIKGYLLKPLDIEELKKLMDEIVSKKEEALKKQHQLFENRISQAFGLADTIGSVKEMQPERKEDCYSLYLFFLDTIVSGNQKKLYASLYDRLSEYMKKNIQGTDQYALFFLQTNELCLFIEGKEYTSLQSWLKRHGTILEGQANIAAIWTVGREFAELYLNKQIMLAMSTFRILEKNYTTVSLQELNNQNNLMEKRFLCEKIEMLTAAYKTGNYGMANELLQEMEHNERLRFYYEKIDCQPLLSYLSVVWQSSFEETGYFGLLSRFRRIIKEGMWIENSEKKDVILQIKEYVRANYMDDVTIAEIGSRFNISPSYISRIFKEKTGEKYIDFVTAVRMKKAKELLQKESCLTVRDVAERVGYASEKHFSKTFKKYFDCVPSHIDRE